MAFSTSAADALKFRFRKTGGAKMVMRIAVWRDPGTPQQERVRLLFVGSAPSKVETPAPLEALGAGKYQVVAVIMVEEAVSGTYDYEASLNGHVFAARSGDVNTSAGLDVEPFIHRENLTVT
ncbi:hypothetical protein [Piscinibacter sp. HJYY11]|uniref:hypothetical protein n=1 Tax=Piscinibacter sp. HJYY11 TaxID=2801333 RepID=UPI00191F5548|nr:hypothetical protein [Piscinibacter sp. HJYY11]MBL0728596.1 hypothetical protein [Piscinibacter sp. HJYY11]